MSTPSLTVVTINYNNASGLKTTVESVLAQTWSPIEYVIIDGGSTDGSRQIIEANASYLAYWVSEEDRGIYHAMNKGIEKATGKYLLFLNSGDYLYDSGSVAAILGNDPDEDIVFGDMLMKSEQSSWTKTHPDKLTFEFFLRDTLPHPGSFIKRELFGKTGLYDEQFKIISDWEFFMNAVCRCNASYRHVQQVVSVFNEEGVSSNPANFAKINKEKEVVYARHYKAFMEDYERLDQYRAELNNVKNSRLHKIIFGLQRSGLFKLFGKH